MRSLNQELTKNMEHWHASIGEVVKRDAGLFQPDFADSLHDFACKRVCKLPA